MQASLNGSMQDVAGNVYEIGERLDVAAWSKVLTPAQQVGAFLFPKLATGRPPASGSASGPAEPIVGPDDGTPDTARWYARDGARMGATMLAELHQTERIQTRCAFCATLVPVRHYSVARANRTCRPWSSLIGWEKARFRSSSLA